MTCNIFIYRYNIEDPFTLYFRKSPITIFEKDENFSATIDHDYCEIVIDKSDLSKEEEILNDFFQKIKVGLRCDIMDIKKHWYNGEIKEYNEEGLTVHFYGFSASERMYLLY